MARRLVRAGAYLPVFTDGVGRVGAPDEDAFTFAATAIERATGAGADARPASVVHWVGPSPSPDAAHLAAMVGGPVQLSVSPAGEEALAASITAATAATGPEWVVAVANGATAGGHGPRVYGAAALLFDDGPGDEPEDILAAAGPRGGPVAGQVHRLLSIHPPPRPAAVWAGDWGADLRSGRPAPPVRELPPEPTPQAVSQGAFVPPARDEEARPSRWRLLADRCTACRSLTFPSRGRCGTCGWQETLQREALPLNGWRVVAVTWIGAGGQPTEFDDWVASQGPYGVVLAEVDRGVRVTLPLADTARGDVRVGSVVDTRLRRLYPMEGAWRYGRKAVPAAP